MNNNLKPFYQNRIRWRNYDPWLMLAVIILTCYGILMIQSAVTGVPAWVRFPMIQLRWMIIGLTISFIISLIDYRIFLSLHWYIYVGLIVVLIYLLLSGQECNNTRRCIQITSTVAIQPSEFGRVFLVITLSQILVNRKDLIHKFSNTILLIIYTLIPALLIFLQPDLGMSILFLSIWFMLSWISSLPVSHFLTLFVVGLFSFIFLFPSLETYQQERLLTFLNPSEADDDDRFNIVQSEISIGTGGLFGKGYMQGTQSQLGFLRVQHTDFIFSVIVEEMGLIFGAFVVIFLEGFIIWRILRISLQCVDLAGKLICSGIAYILFFQTFVNIGMNVQVFPVTGLTLPFVSYGGSSIITLYMALGFVQSVALRKNKQEFG